MRKHVHPGIEYSDMIWIPCLATISQGLFMTYSGHLEELIGIRWTIVSGATTMSVGVLLTSISIRVRTLRINGIVVVLSFINSLTIFKNILN